MGEENEGKKKKLSSEDDVEDVSFDGSGLNYDMDGFSGKINGGNSSNAISNITGRGEEKGKQKLRTKAYYTLAPAHNIFWLRSYLYKRRSRKKFNESCNLLKSLVTNISKNDTLSILGGVVEYMKDLKQKIDNLKNELESTSPGSSLTPTTRLHSLTPTPPTLPSHINDEVLPSPNGQAARVEIAVREGKAVQIHVCCEHKPGILVSTMRAMDNLGLDIQQGVISCSNGFVMDVYRAEMMIMANSLCFQQCKEGQDVQPEQIRAELLDSAGVHEEK